MINILIINILIIDQKQISRNWTCNIYGGIISNLCTTYPLDHQSTCHEAPPKKKPYLVQTFDLPWSSIWVDLSIFQTEIFALRVQFCLNCGWTFVYIIRGPMSSVSHMYFTIWSGEYVVELSTIPYMAMAVQLMGVLQHMAVSINTITWDTASFDPPTEIWSQKINRSLF